MASAITGTPLMSSYGPPLSAEAIAGMSMEEYAKLRQGVCQPTLDFGRRRYLEELGKKCRYCRRRFQADARGECRCCGAPEDA